MIRAKYDDFAVIVPGWAKSAGTVISMAADEILMGDMSALGPIDAQLAWQGKQFSAEALIKGVEKIKDEVASTGVLNQAYIPILQGISPGELQSAENAQEFAKKLVERWLAQYKFKDWTKHSSTGQPVTSSEKKTRAAEIAHALRDHSEWLTHGRSLKIRDFEAMKLKITDYSKDKDLNDAVTRYYTLLQMTFASNMYKIYETADSQVVKFHITPGQAAPPPDLRNAGTAREANRILRRSPSGEPFWQRESYDRVVRNEAEALRVARYIENSPVAAGLAGQPSEYQWSSAGFDELIETLRRGFQARRERSRNRATD